MHPWIWFSAILFGVTSVAAKDAEVVRLPPPQMSGGMPLMQALHERHSTREFAARPLEPQVLANLLWAADGVNRPETGKRTAPSARDWREIDIYVATADGTYVYEPTGNALRLVVAKDLRALTGMQDFVGTAPLDLVYVADRRRMVDAGEADRDRYANTDTGFIAQNVYLFCASNGLNVVVRGSVDREALAKALHLNRQQQVILAQTVGYPE